MFNLFKRKPEDISRTNPGYEEAERRTPKTGIILLIAMFVAGLFFGWQAIDDLARIPTIPSPLSYCSSAHQTGYLVERTVQPYDARPLYDPNPYYPSARDYSDCNWSDLEKNYRIPELFAEKLAPLEKKLDEVLSELNSVQNSLRQTKDEADKLLQQYGIGLEERQAGIESPLFPTDPTVRATFINLKNQEATFLEKQSEIEKEKNALENALKAVRTELTEAYTPVLQEQNTRLRWYEFKVFLLQFIFVFPFFFLVFWGYLRLHRKSSPYTVIFTAMVGVASILLLRIVLTWFWGLFLQRVLEVLARWFAEFEIFQSILYYLGMILAFAVFGGAVYFLQRKIFDPRRVALRRFRAKQCPQCQTSLDLAVHYCPNCGSQVRAKCPSCGEARFVGLPNCPHCGAKA